MTKDAYYQMCDDLKCAPVEDEIPIDITDFSDFIQACFGIYSRLPDIWDYMNGNYAGKDLNIVFELFRLYNLKHDEEQLLALDFLSIMDATRSSIITAKLERNKPATKK